MDSSNELYPPRIASPEDLLRHASHLRRLALALAADETGADDLLQETWVRAIAAPPRLGAQTIHWLRTVLRNIARRAHRDQTRRRAREKRVAQAERIDAAAESAAEEGELLKQLTAHVAELPEPYRTVILLRYYKGHTVPLIARRLAVDPSTVRRRLGGAHERLRSALDASYSRGRDGWVGVAVPFADAAWTPPTAFSGLTGSSVATVGEGVSNLASVGTLTTGGIAMAGKLVTAGTVVVAGMALGFGVGRTSANRTEESAPEDVVAGSVHRALESRRADLEARLRRAEAELASARAAAAAREAPHVDGEVASTPHSSPSGELSGPALSFADLRELLINNELDRLADIPTPEQIEETLASHGRETSYLIAASLLAADPTLALAYLEEALEKDPTSPAALLRAADLLIREGRFDQNTKELLDEFVQSDPANSLGRYYEALWHFENGNSTDARDALRAAGVTSHLKDYAIHHLPAFEDFYRDATGSESVGKVLAAMGLRLDYLQPLRRLSEHAAEEVERRLQTHGVDATLDLVQALSRIGMKLSATGRFLVQDVVGLSIEARALERERVLLADRGDQERLPHIEDRLARIEQLKAEAKAIAQRTERAFAELSEEELVAYFERVALEGETAAAKSLVLGEE